MIVHLEAGKLWKALRQRSMPVVVGLRMHFGVSALQHIRSLSGSQFAICLCNLFYPRSAARIFCTEPFRPPSPCRVPTRGQATHVSLSLWRVDFLPIRTVLGQWNHWTPWYLVLSHDWQLWPALYISGLGQLFGQRSQIVAPAAAKRVQII